MKGLKHFARGGDGKEVDHVLFKLHRHGGQILSRTNVPHHGKNLVLVDQFLGSQKCLFGVVARVFDFDGELAAIDAALLVEFVHGQQHAQAHLLAKTRQGAGEVLDRAQIDFGLAHAL